MGTWNAAMDVEVPVAMPRRLYVQARANWYRAHDGQEGRPLLPRNDAALPFPVPPGSVLARKITGFEERRIQTTGEGVGNATGVERFPIYGDPASDYAVDPALYVFPDEAAAINAERMRAALAVPFACPIGSRRVDVPVTEWGIVVYTVSECRRPDGTLVAPVPGPDARPLDLAPFAIGNPPISVPPAQRPEGASSFDYLAGWRAAQVGDFALEGSLGLSLRPGAGADPRSHDWWAASSFAEELLEFRPPNLRGAYESYDAPLEIPLGRMRFVAIRDPHPWIPAEALPPHANGVAEPFRVRTSYTGGAQFTHVYRLVKADRVLFHLAHRHGLAEFPHPAVPEGVITGTYVDHADGNFFKQPEAAYLFAGLVVLTGIYLPYLIAAPAFATSVASAGLVVTGTLAAAETATGLDLGGKDALREAAKASAYLGGFDDFWGVILRELAVMVQDPDDRDRLRVRLATIRADLDERGGVGLVVARTVVQVATAIATANVAQAGTFAQQVSIDLAQQALSALEGVAEANNGVELERIITDQIRERTLAAVDQLIDRVNQAAHNAREDARSEAIAEEASQSYGEHNASPDLPATDHPSPELRATCFPCELAAFIGELLDWLMFKQKREAIHG